MMSLDHLFFTFGKDVISRWINTLKLFRLCSTYPYPNDLKPVRFMVAINMKTADEINSILEKLVFEPDTSKPDGGFKKYNENHSAGWVIIKDQFCYLDVNKLLKTIYIEVAGVDDDLFKMDESVFQRALVVEDFLQQLNLTFIDPPQDDSYCIAPKFYPDVFLEAK
jgi:hypothetical protein